VTKPPRLPVALAELKALSAGDGGAIAESILRGDFTDWWGEDHSLERSRLVQAQLIGTASNRLRALDVRIESSDLSGSDFDESSFTRVVFHECRLSGAVFTRCSFRDVLFSGCRLNQANFAMSETSTVMFEDTDLRESDFYAANLGGTRFFDCNLSGAQFSKATTIGVRFHGSTLTDLKGGQALAGAVIESSQVLPVALAVLSDLGIGVDDERDAPVPADSKGRGGRGPSAG
jgi:uncharacterized protein YjbI with pentapeptide repeats